jgi:hypothetical protein
MPAQVVAVVQEQREVMLLEIEAAMAATDYVL